ncbi:MAG: 1-acyl-sn-glycerol-3-phosphate acyltransferase [Treponema sp.]|nr:1-acyl-sn-glycerol-3-phosphate acyltransferase [Treponema sp.]
MFTYICISVIFLLPFGFIGFMFYLIGLRKSMRFVIYKIAQGWAFSIMALIGSKISVSGNENIPKKGGVCFVSNHSGYFDIILLLAFSKRPFGFVAKKELLLLPFINFWIYMLGGLFIDRRNVRKALKTIGKGVKQIQAGGGMVIFPEGTRSRGRGLLPFHQGSLKLATKAEAIIIPVAIEGSYELFEKTYRIVSAPIKITFLEGIDTAALSNEERKVALSDRIHAAIKGVLDKDNSLT